jgi:hypothetical protein
MLFDRLFSEHQRVYGVGREGPPDGFIREKGHMGKEVSRKMKDMAKHSHVFRMGDYNGIGNITMCLPKCDFLQV